jgi:hypothetical protein
MHNTDEVDAHTAVPHEVIPSVDVGVVAPIPKFRPVTVALNDADPAPLSSDTKLTMGPAKDLMRNRHPLAPR